MHDSDQIEEFMGELYDKFYPQVMEGLEMMRSGNVQEGIENLARPLHTIKGVTGFIEGFEEASHFTHTVESFLKKIQAGEVALHDNISDAAIESVNMIFQVIEQIKESGAGPHTEISRISQLLKELSTPEGADSPVAEGSITVRLEETTMIATVTMPRLHLPEQRKPLIELFEKQSDGVPLLVDISQVLSISSDFLSEILPHAKRFPLHILGPSPQVSGIICSWGYDKALYIHNDYSAYELSFSTAKDTR